MRRATRTRSPSSPGTDGLHSPSTCVLYQYPQCPTWIFHRTNARTRNPGRGRRAKRSNFCMRLIAGGGARGEAIHRRRQLRAAVPACQTGLKGEKEVVEHAKATGHQNFGECEYSTHHKDLGLIPLLIPSPKSSVSPCSSTTASTPSSPCGTSPSTVIGAVSAVYALTKVLAFFQRRRASVMEIRTSPSEGSPRRRLPPRRARRARCPAPLCPPARPSSPEPAQRHQPRGEADRQGAGADDDGHEPFRAREVHEGHWAVRRSDALDERDLLWPPSSTMMLTNTVALLWMFSNTFSSDIFHCVDLGLIMVMTNELKITEFAATPRSGGRQCRAGSAGFRPRTRAPGTR